MVKLINAGADARFGPAGLAACNTLANWALSFAAASTPPTQLLEGRGSTYSIVLTGGSPRRHRRAVASGPKQSHRTQACGSASATAPPRTESPSRTEAGAGPSCLLLRSGATSFGARTAASSTRSITRRRNSGRVYREIRDRNPSRTLALSLGIPKSTRGRRRGLNARNILGN